MPDDNQAENTVITSDFVRPLSGCGCPSCGRNDGAGWKADSPADDPHIAAGTVDTVPASISTTFTITPGGTVTGTVNPVADRDWYAITLQAGQQYTFNLNGTSGTMAALSDPYLRLYNGAGTQVAFNDDIGNGNLNSRLTFTAETTGTYYLAAGAYGDTGAGSYTLTASTGSTPPPANPLDSLNWGTVRTLGAGNVINVYFARNGDAFSGETANRDWTASEIQQAMLAFQQFSNVINVSFQQVTNASQASFRLVQNNNAPSTSLGWFEVANGATQVTGWFNNGASSWSAGGLAQGGTGFMTLVHEFGHGLGLAHPHDDGGSSTIMQGVTDPFGSFGTGNLNQNIFSVMSYNDGWATGPQGVSPSGLYGQMGTLGALDIASLQADYGANTSHRTGNDIYDLPDSNAAGTFYSSIWDAGGTDLIRYAGARNVTIDLRAATLAQSNGGGGYVSFADTIHGGFTIAANVVIENASGGSGNDTLTGNGAGNMLTGGAGNDTLTGHAGNDTFVYSSGADVITDFVAGGMEDSINLTGLGTFTTLAQVIARGAQVGSNAVFTFSAGNTLTLSGVALGALTANDFLSNGSALAGGITGINGTAGADVLSGTTGVDSINGLAGNDTIDGRGGGDTIAGGDNDDRIVYYASDTPSNITGGNGTDTLVIINGTAPTSFNLAAQGFEAAQHVRHDLAGNQAWTMITENYNATWQLLSTDRINDDNTRVVYSHDRGSLSWSIVTDNYNSAGGRIRQDIVNDDGTYRYYYWDLSNGQTWTTFDEEYTASGVRAVQRIQNDNGTSRTFYWDATNTQSWSTFDEEYAAGGARMIQRVVNDNGTNVTQTFDHSNTQAWSTITDFYNAAGQRTEQRVTNDNNSYVRLFYDPTNVQTWSTRTDTYNVAGVLVSSVQVPD